MKLRGPLLKRPPSRWRRFWTALLLVGVCAPPLIGVLSVPLLNAPHFQRTLLAAVSRFSQWEIQAAWRIDLRRQAIEIHDVTMINDRTHDRLIFPYIALHFRPWSLLRGVVALRDLQIDQPQLTFLARAVPDAPSRPIKLRTLLLLRRLRIESGTIRDATVTLPTGRQFTCSTATLRFIPQLLRDVALDIELAQTIIMQPNRPPLYLDHLALHGATSVGNWRAEPPFLNDVQGTLDIGLLGWKTLQVHDLHTQIHYLHTKATISEFRAVIQGKPLEAQGTLAFAGRTSDFRLEIPEPMPIPELQSAQSFFRSDGAIQGSVAWQGALTAPEGPTGTLRVELTQIPADVTTIPATLLATGEWHEGVMTLKDSTLTVGDGRADLTGTIDVPRRRIEIRADGRHLPLLGVLGRFRNRDFHPVSGAAECRGSFVGWARDYVLDLDFETEPGSAYQGIVIESARAHLHLTYPQLDLEGSILQGGAVTGRTRLQIRYGPKQADGYRLAQMHLEAQVQQHRLDPSFTLIGLRGIGTGQIVLDGIASAPHGRGRIEVRDGRLGDIDVTHFESPFVWQGKELRLQPMRLHSLPFEPIEYPAPLVVALGQGARFRGQPGHGLSLDVAYSSLSKSWTVQQINIREPGVPATNLTITGHGRSGAWDLLLRGTANAAWLQYLPAEFREAEGPLAVHLRLQGNIDDPSLSGTVGLTNNRLLLRAFPQEWAGLQGQLQFSGHRIALQNVTGTFGDGPFQMSGWAEQSAWVPTRFDLDVRGHSMAYTADNRAWRAEFDPVLHLSRLDGRVTTIRGDIELIDYRYTRDFRILEQFTQSEAQAVRERMRAVAAGYDDIRLELRVVSRGDLLIRNNAAEIALRADTRVLGTMATPQITGKVEAVEGKIHYLGLAFDVTGGGIEFHAPFSEPFVEFRGEQTIGAHLVQVGLRGPVNNLRVELTAIPGEDRKNILCLVAYGTTCDQLRNIAFGAKIGPGVFAEQLGKVLERPLARYTKLDVVRIEAAVGTTDLSRLHIGKRINDRLEIGFVTTVGQTAAEQSLEASYQLTDNLVLKASQSTRGNFGGRVSLRFRER